MPDVSPPSRPSIDSLIVHDDPEPITPRDLILGADGKVHRGEVRQKFTATLMAMCCDAEPLRPLGDGEAKFFAGRECATCIAALDDHDRPESGRQADA